MTRPSSFWRRPKRDVTDTARRTIHESLDGRFRVLVVRSLYGLPTRVLACERVAVGGEYVRSRHRKVQAAKAACEALR